MFCSKLSTTAAVAEIDYHYLLWLTWHNTKLIECVPDHSRSRLRMRFHASNFVSVNEPFKKQHCYIASIQMRLECEIGERVKNVAGLPFFP